MRMYSKDHKTNGKLFILENVMENLQGADVVDAKSSYLIIRIRLDGAAGVGFKGGVVLNSFSTQRKARNTRSWGLFGIRAPITGPFCVLKPTIIVPYRTSQEQSPRSEAPVSQPWLQLF